MKCPFCHEDKNKVTGRGEVTQYSHTRYRRCLNCGKRFKTVEYFQPDFPKTIDGRIVRRRIAK